jgi:hypothetical protein
MSTIHEEWAKALALGFNGPVNQRLYAALGATIGDRTLDDAQAMVVESLPSYASAAANGLTGNDRVLERGPSETDASYAARLVAYVDQWRLAGAPVGLLLQLQYTGFSGAILVQQNGLAHYLSGTIDLADLATFVANWKAQTPSAFPSWYVRATLPNGNPALPASADGKAAIPALTIPWWAFDAGMDAEGNQFCSRFALVFPSTSSPGLGTASNLARLRRIVEAWKPGRVLCMGFYVQTSGTTWNQIGALFGGFTWGGSSTFYSA